MCVFCKDWHVNGILLVLLEIVIILGSSAAGLYSLWVERLCARQARTSGATSTVADRGSRPGPGTNWKITKHSPTTYNFEENFFYKKRFFLITPPTCREVLSAGLVDIAVVVAARWECRHRADLIISQPRPATDT